MSPSRPPNRLLRCRVCNTREDPDAPTVGPRATGATNTRALHGVAKDVAHVVCQTCGHQWHSPTRRALYLARTMRGDAAAGA